MVLSPAVIALVLGSALISLVAAAAAFVGAGILRGWDPASGSAAQLARERRTYLVSTAFSVVLVFQIASLFLFAYTGESLHTLFVGAMCAAGTFGVNDYGYPALMLRLANAVACGVWLIVNRADSRAPDYPLLRAKYRMLLPLAGSLLLESYLQLRYFGLMQPNLITSCCGTLFSENAPSVAGSLAHASPALLQAILFLGTALALRLGLEVVLAGRRALPYAWVSAGLLAASLAAVISFISVFYYELPTHHCPFCLLQKEYGYIGYLLYAAILLAGSTGIAMGALERLGRNTSLRAALPAIHRRLCLASMAGWLVVAAIAAWPLVFSDFKLSGY